ncbi:MAG: hypothetical protein WAZ14_00115 [Patescibacteria group bacterium]
MRFQSTYEKISQGTSQNIFAACFVALRIAVGVACLYLAVNALQMPATEIAADPGSALYYHELADQQALTRVAVPIGVVMGLAFLLGVLVRPISILVILGLIFFGLQSGSIYPERVFLTTVICSLGFILFAAGGSSHALGLDGIISRNIRKANVLTRFLFG